MKDSAAVAWVRTQAGPTIRIALRKASYLLWPASMRSRAAKVSCMLSEKLITMISGVITLRNMLSRKSSQPSAPSANRMATQRRPGGDDHEGDAPEEQDGDEAAGDEAGDVVDQPVALDRGADLKLHDRNAGEFGLEAGAGEIVRHRLADFA